MVSELRFRVVATRALGIPRKLFFLIGDGRRLRKLAAVTTTFFISNILAYMGVGENIES